MCGRVKLSGDVSEIKIAFRIPPDYPTPNFAPSWNVAPTDQLPIIRFNPVTKSRTLDLMRWGLVPYWAKDIKVGFSTINAMAETIDTKTVFREAFRRRRCLVPVEAYYEWKKLDAKTKQPYAFALAEGGFMALAGLWEMWKSPADEVVRSFTIATTTPNALAAEIHSRMPVILPLSAWPAWLGEEDAAGDADLKGLLAPYPADRMKMWPVSPRVGNVKNNDPSLIEPVALA
jgi:putative SOS response-associated peptidase YedK